MILGNLDTISKNISEDFLVARGFIFSKYLFFISSIDLFNELIFLPLITFLNFFSCF